MAPPPSHSSSSSCSSLFHHLFRSNLFFSLLQSQMLQHQHDSILFFALFFATLSLLLSLTFLYRKRSLSKTPQHPGPTRNPETRNDPTAFNNKHSLSRWVEDDREPRPGENGATHLTSSVFVEVLASDSAKWATLIDDPDSVSSGLEGPGAEEQRGKKKRRKGKKKKASNSGAEEKGGEKTGSDPGVRFESGCLYPFTSSSSAMQRKIKLQYDELVKSNDSKKLTLAQVVKFANSLVDARNELQHKADVIQRKFVITKALLCKADRSSFDRLRPQIYKLELEQKRLEEDAFVYNSLQQQLKLSPAYQKMLEVGACMEKAKSCESGDNRDDEFADISFEELLAQEKKDSFWQKNGKSRLSSS